MSVPSNEAEAPAQPGIEDILAQLKTLRALVGRQGRQIAQLEQEIDDLRRSTFDSEDMRGMGGEW